MTKIWLADVQVHDGTNFELLDDGEFGGGSPSWTLNGSAALSIRTLRIINSTDYGEQTPTVTDADDYTCRVFARRARGNAPNAKDRVTIEFGDSTSDGSIFDSVVETGSWVTHSGVFGATHRIRLKSRAVTGIHVSYANASLRKTVDYTKLYFSTGAYTTAAADTPSAQTYDPRITSEITFSQSIDIGDGAEPRARQAIGELTLANTDGALDDYLDRSWTGRPITIRTVEQGAALSTAVTILTGQVTAIIANESSIRLLIRDNSAKLDRMVPALTYNGSGSAYSEGTSIATDRVQPIGLGEARYVSPTLIDSPQLEYGVHQWCWANTIPNVYDGGVALTRIATGSPSASQFLDLQGVIKLGARPTNKLTAISLQTNISGTLLFYASAWLPYILEYWGEIPAADQDIPALSTTRDPTPAQYLDSPRPLASVIDELVRAIPGFWFFKRNGKFSLREINVPGTSVATYTDAQIQRIERTRSIEPAWQIRIRNTKTHAVHTEEEVASGASNSLHETLLREYQIDIAEDASVRATNENARMIEYTFQTNDEQLRDVPDRLLAMHGTRRDYLSVSVAESAGVLELGDTITIARTRRPSQWNKDYLIIGMTERSGSPFIDLQLWG